MDILEQLREDVANMDSEVDFPRTLEEAEQFKCILERIEGGTILQSDLRKIKDWNIYPWLVSKLESIGINVTIIIGK